MLSTGLLPALLDRWLPGDTLHLLHPQVPLLFTGDLLLLEVVEVVEQPLALHQIVQVLGDAIPWNWMYDLWVPTGPLSGEHSLFYRDYLEFCSCPSSSIPTLVTDSLIHYIQFVPNHTNLSRLCFAKHNAAHHHERTIMHIRWHAHCRWTFSIAAQEMELFWHIHQISTIFSCPSSSIPTSVIHSFIHSFIHSLINSLCSIHTKPYQP